MGERGGKQSQRMKIKPSTFPPPVPQGLPAPDCSTVSTHAESTAVPWKAALQGLLLCSRASAAAASDVGWRHTGVLLVGMHGSRQCESPSLTLQHPLPDSPPGHVLSGQ